MDFGIAGQSEIWDLQWQAWDAVCRGADTLYCRRITAAGRIRF